MWNTDLLYGLKESIEMGDVGVYTTIGGLWVYVRISDCVKFFKAEIEREKNNENPLD